MCTAFNTLMVPLLAVVFCGVVSAQINYPTCTSLWKEQGCKIGFHHKLSILIDDRHPNAAVQIDWHNLQAYLHNLKCRCREAGRNKGFSWFAINRDGICLSAKGTLDDYRKLHPFEDPKNCTGQISITSYVNNRACVTGLYRAFFYTIENPIQSSPEQGYAGEEIAASPQAHGGGEEIAASPQAQGSEEEIAASPQAQGSEEEIAASPQGSSEEEIAKPASNPTQGSEEQVAVEPIVDGACTTAADVILIMDMSGSVKEEGVITEKNFANQFLGRFNLKKSRVGIITYDSNITSILTWEQSGNMSTAEMNAYVNNITYHGGETMTQRALTYARQLIVDPQRRENVNCTVITMTDGVTWGGTDRLHEPAKLLRDKCKMVAIGIGEYDYHELMAITKNSTNIIRKEDFNSLESDMGNVIMNLLEKSCI